MKSKHKQFDITLYFGRTLVIQVDISIAKHYHLRRNYVYDTILLPHFLVDSPVIDFVENMRRVFNLLHLMKAKRKKFDLGAWSGDTIIIRVDKYLAKYYHTTRVNIINNVQFPRFVDKSPAYVFNSEARWFIERQLQ